MEDEMNLKVYVYGSEEDPLVGESIALLQEKGVTRVDTPEEADVAIAPMLQKFLTKEQLDTPKYGTLIFHPSLLPRHRGRDAIRWASKNGEPYTWAAWFWADEGVDTGDICEMEALAIKPGASHVSFYMRKVMPSALKMLGWILEDLANGYVHRRPQDEKNATHEAPIKDE
jgi:methionyl-tRNA formyltransferase